MKVYLFVRSRSQDQTVRVKQAILQLPGVRSVDVVLDKADDFDIVATLEVGGPDGLQNVAGRVEKMQDVYASWTVPVIG